MCVCVWEGGELPPLPPCEGSSHPGSTGPEIPGEITPERGQKQQLSARWRSRRRLHFCSYLVKEETSQQIHARTRTHTRTCTHIHAGGS